MPVLSFHVNPCSSKTSLYWDNPMVPNGDQNHRQPEKLYNSNLVFSTVHLQVGWLWNRHVSCSVQYTNALRVYSRRDATKPPAKSERSCNSQLISWWCHQMETFSALLDLCAGNSPVTGEFPAQRPVTRSFDVFFDLRQNERLSKQSWGWRFETPSRPLWRHGDVK